MSEYIESIGKKSKDALKSLRKLTTDQKNAALIYAAEALRDNSVSILEANAKDMENARKNGMSEALLDRLSLTESRIDAMAKGMMEVSALPDPVGEVISMEKRPNGLMIGKQRVAIGVIGVIYESRPNVTSDAFALCFKSGNACILRGGSDCINSNIAITDALRIGLKKAGVTEDAVVLIENTDREYAVELMRLNRYVDLIIPRGGHNLIHSCIENSTVPCIQTGEGNCHVYVEKTADFTKALEIIKNAKLQRLGVCNAIESLVVDSEIAESFLPLLYDLLCTGNGVTIYGDSEAKAILPGIENAKEEDFYTEYLDKKISLKINHGGVDNAIDFINEHSTGHSESIITEDYETSLEFLNGIDSAAVYVNASTRFTDGGEFGMGCEIGISTQKLHARGPLGLKELTTLKYIILGNGQIR